MDYIFDLIKYAMLTEIGSGRKAAPGWAYVVSACLALYGWRGVQQMRSKIKRVQNEAQKQLSSEKTLSATALTANDGRKISAVIKETGRIYVLSISTQSSGNEKTEILEEFDSVGALSAFLESKTVLRLGDFK
ncbi:hypothetical protein ACVBEF_14655 [Glaciimonas sp. GG7]